MKKTILKGMSVIGLLLATAACDDSLTYSTDDYGHIAPVVGLDTKVNVSKDVPHGSRAGADGSLTVDDLTFRMSSADGSYFQEWTSVADIEKEEIPIGEYLFEAYYGDSETAGFECPAYYGKQEKVRVETGKTTPLMVTARLAHTKFSVECSEAFRKYMSDWTVTLSDSKGNRVEYGKEESRAAYFSPGKIVTSIAFTTVAGKKGSLNLDAVDAKSCCHYAVKVDINDGEVGDGKLLIDFSDELTEEIVEIMLDGLVSSEAPVVSPDGFTEGTAYEFVEMNRAAAPLKMDIVAAAGFKSVVLRTEGNLPVDRSDLAARRTWPAVIDLVLASPDDMAPLEKMGLHVVGLSAADGTLACVDFTNVLGYIGVTDGENVTTFTLEVTDTYNRKSYIEEDGGKPTELKVHANELKLALDLSGVTYKPGEPVTVGLTYNGTYPEDNVRLQYLNYSSQRMMDLPISCTPVNESEGLYSMTFTAPADLGQTATVNSTDLEIKASAGSKNTGISNLRIPIAEYKPAEPVEAYPYSVSFGAVWKDDGTAAAPKYGKFAVRKASETDYAVRTVQCVDGRYTIDGLDYNTDYVLKDAFDSADGATLSFRTTMPYQVSVEDNNVFATFAYASIVPIGNAQMPQLASPMSFGIKKSSETSYTEIAQTQSSGFYRFESLEPATAYDLRLMEDSDNSHVVHFTTEAAPQLPEKGMDNWTSEKKGDYQYLWKVASGTSWGTMNELTTSTSGSGSGNGLNTGGCAYKATSGTIPANGRSTQSQADGGGIGTIKHSDGHTEGNATLHSDKQHSGANAALIRTVGWGSGNSASRSDNRHTGTCQNITAGELYLGSYSNGAPVYGYDFGSRPSGLSFWYRYDVATAGNGDYGTVEVKVMDAAGIVIAQGNKNLSETAAYTAVEIPLQYGLGSVKAARISVVFKSTGRDPKDDHATDFFICPGKMNTSGGEYVGSELYIDDIELIY